MTNLILIGSVPKELGAERRALEDHIQGDALLGHLFDVDHAKNAPVVPSLGKRIGSEMAQLAQPTQRPRRIARWRLQQRSGDAVRNEGEPNE